MLAQVRGPVIAVSPHLDDAVLSIGATLAALARRGVPTTVLTVLANNPADKRPAGRWDSRANFATSGHAASRRRLEDARACAELGVSPVWLPYEDDEHLPRTPVDEIHRAVRDAIAEAGTVLVPGFPLVHPDHAFVAELASDPELIGDRDLYLYVEQPYAVDDHVSYGGRAPSAPRQSRLRRSANILRAAAMRQQLREPDITLPANLAGSLEQPQRWRPSGAGLRDWARKQRAIGAYSSQLPMLRSFLRIRIGLCEFGAGGELLVRGESASES